MSRLSRLSICAFGELRSVIRPPFLLAVPASSSRCWPLSLATPVPELPSRCTGALPIPPHLFSLSMASSCSPLLPLTLQLLLGLTEDVTGVGKITFQQLARSEDGRAGSWQFTRPQAMQMPSTNSEVHRWPSHSIQPRWPDSHESHSSLMCHSGYCLAMALAHRWAGVGLPANKVMSQHRVGPFDRLGASPAPRYRPNVPQVRIAHSHHRLSANPSPSSG